MLALQRWAKDKSFFLAFLGPQIAGAQDIHTAFKEIKERRVLGHQFPLPNFKSWFPLYRSHRKTRSFIREMFDFAPFGVDLFSLGEDLQEYSKLNRELSSEDRKSLLQNISPEEIQEANNRLAGLLELSYEDIRGELQGQPIIPEQKEAFLSFLLSDDDVSAFFFLVVVPCWLLYRQSPTLLYRQARQGEPKAIEKLLRLDPLLIHDALIGFRIQQFRLKRKSILYEGLVSSVLKRPKAKITRKRMKIAMAGCVSAISHLINQPLTERQIRELFDAAAQDYLKKSIDTDLPESPEAFTRAIHRERSVWLQAFQLDKKI